MMRLKNTILFGFLLLGGLHPPGAQADGSEDAIPVVATLALPTMLTGLHAKTALSGEALSLDDGRTLRLEGIKVAPPDARMRAEAAKQQLGQLAQGKILTVTDARTDRYGRISGDVAASADGGPIMLQDELLKEGLAYVYPSRGNEPRLDAMRSIETEARAAKKGIWGDTTYADVSPTQMKGDNGRIGSFAFVRGAVTDAKLAKNMVYLSFGKDEQTNFTVAIAARDLYMWQTVKLDPLTYAGKIIRVRGWVEKRDGPVITVTHPAQIDILGDVPLEKALLAAQHSATAAKKPIQAAVSKTKGLKAQAMDTRPEP